MTRPDFVAALAASAATAHLRSPIAEIAAEIAITRESDALLAPFTVALALRNRSQATVGIDFPTTDLYRIDVRRDDTTLWSSAAGYQPRTIARRIDVPPGVMRLVSHVVDGTTDDRRAFAPGRYVVRVTMLGARLRTVIERTLEFRSPTPIAEAKLAKPDEVQTIGGVPSVVNGLPYLSDASGTLRLAHALGLAPTGSYIVRGAIESLGGDDREFAIQRFAPAFENQPTPAPTR